MTQRRKSTSSACAAFVALFGVWGCASDPKLVYVDLSSIELNTVSNLSRPVDRFGAEEIAESRSIPELEERSVFIGSAEDRAAEALELYLETQKQASEGVLQRLRGAYIAEVDRLEAAGREEVLEEYRSWVNDAVDEIRTLFVEHATDVGEINHKLAWMVGFPDPDPDSINVPPDTDETGKKEFEQAKLLREKLKELNGAFRSVVSDKFERLESMREAELRQISSRFEVLRSDAVDRASEEAATVSERALAVLQRSALDPQAQLSAVPGASSAVNSDAVSPEPWSDEVPPQETQESLREQLELFLKVHSYRLTDDPAKGRQATNEFVAWRRIYLAGR